MLNCGVWVFSLLSEEETVSKLYSRVNCIAVTFPWISGTENFCIDAVNLSKIEPRLFGCNIQFQQTIFVDRLKQELVLVSRWTLNFHPLHLQLTWSTWPGCYLSLILIYTILHCIVVLSASLELLLLSWPTKYKIAINGQWSGKWSDLYSKTSVINFQFW